MNAKELSYKLKEGIIILKVNNSTVGFNCIWVNEIK